MQDLQVSEPGDFLCLDNSVRLVIIAFVLKNANDLQMHCICNLKRYDGK